MSEPREEGARGSAVKLAVAALLAAAITTGLHLPRLDRPLEQSLASASTTYMVMFFRNWDEAGFLALKGLPAVGTGGETLEERVPYLHHPVLSYWAMYAARHLFGWQEASFRLVPMLATILGAALTVLLAARVVGPGLALAAGVLFGVIPLGYAFGMMPNSDPLVVTWLLGGFLLHLRARDRGRGHGLLYAWFFVGALIEWQAYFLAPALLVYELLQPKGERRLRPVLWLFPLGVMAVGLIMTHFAWGLGSFGALVEDVERTIEETWRGAADHDLAGYLLNQLKTWSKFFGWPLLALALVLLGTAVLRPGRLRRHPGSLVAALAVPGILAMTLFRTPAYDHDFFWMPILIMLPTGVVVLLREVTRRSAVAGSALAVLVFVWCVALDFAHERLTDSPFYRDLGFAVNLIAEPDDLVISPDTVAPTMFYTRAHFRAGKGTTPAFIEAVLERRTQGRLFFDRLFLFFHEAHADDNAALATWASAHGRPLTFPRARAWIIE